MWYELSRVRRDAASGDAEAAAVCVAEWWGPRARWEWDDRAAGTFRAVGGSTRYRVFAESESWVFEWESHG